MQTDCFDAYACTLYDYDNYLLTYVVEVQCDLQLSPKSKKSTGTMSGLQIRILTEIRLTFELFRTLYEHNYFLFSWFFLTFLNFVINSSNFITEYLFICQLEALY